MAIFWDIAPCSPYMNRRFGERYHQLQGRNSAEQETSVRWRGLFRLATCSHATFLLGLFSTLKMDVIRCSETPLHIRTTRCYIPEDGIFKTTAVKAWNPTKKTSWDTRTPFCASRVYSSHEDVKPKLTGVIQNKHLLEHIWQWSCDLNPEYMHTFGNINSIYQKYPLRCHNFYILSVQSSSPDGIKSANILTHHILFRYIENAQLMPMFRFQITLHQF
jgi:hypothetical protein